MKKRLVVAGTGLPEIISLIEDVGKATGDFELMGFVDDNPQNKARELYGYRVLGPFDMIQDLDCYVINSIGRTMELRAKSTDRLLKLGARFVNVIHPTVLLDASSIGVGNVVDRFSIIHRGSRIGSNNLLLSGVVIGHDSRVGDCCFFGHKTVVNGNVSIGNGVFIGASSVVGPSIECNDHCVVGPGSVVLSDVDKGATLATRPPLKLM